MPFSPKAKEIALVSSRRSCCICHEFAGLYTQVHHIVQEADGGPNTLGNAIVLCSRCHGEVGHYNDRHPIGNKYTHSELKGHRDEWWKWCKENPTAPNFKHPIYVSPASSKLLVGDIYHEAHVVVYNSTDFIHYNICVKIGFQLAHIPSSRVILEGLSTKSERSARVGTFSVGGDAYLLYGKDGSGAEARYLFISTLESKASVRFRLKVKRLPGKSNPDQKVLTVHSVTSFELEPSHLQISSNEGTALPFTLPEPFVAQGINILVIHDEGGMS